MTRKLTAAQAKRFQPLDLRQDGGGFRHYLHGIAVHCGTPLELEAGADMGDPIPVRYEASQHYRTGGGLEVTLYTGIRGRTFVARGEPWMKFRWPGLAERLEGEAREAEQEKRARANRKLAASPTNRLRLHPDRGPVILAVTSHDELVACDERGRIFFTSAERALRWSRAQSFQTPIGPLFAPAQEETCWCHKRPNAECPRAKPCIGECGRMTTSWEASACGYCRSCAWLGVEVRFPFPKPQKPSAPPTKASPRTDAAAFRALAHARLNPRAA